VFDFGALPPEINSGRIYAGPGAESMMVAAAAWDGLAAELSAAASGYHSVVTELTSGPWVGPTSAAMVASVVPYVSWLGTTAAQAEESANQARAAAAAFEAAFAMTVSPPEIVANRVLLAALVATNFFGQNTPAIMATEAMYMEMWAQDVAAMFGYAAASAAATQLDPYRPPPNTTTPEGPLQQAAAVAQAVATPAGNSGHTAAATSAQLTSAGAIQGVLQQLSAPVLSQWPFIQIQNFLQFGMLSVPANWTTPTSEATVTLAAMEETPANAGAAGGENALLRGIPMAGVGRRTAGYGYTNKYGFRYSVLTRPPSAG